MPTCPLCSRSHPPGAAYCPHDGRPLHAAALAKAEPAFSMPFVFASGRECRTFDELALACQAYWDEAVGFLRDGTFAAFLATQGRPDLAATARVASQDANPGRGLDGLLRALPARSFVPAKLRVAQGPIDLGTLRPGEDRTVTVRLFNDGMGLLHGSVSSDSPWLGVGPSASFAFHDDAEVVVRVSAKAARAGSTLSGRLLIRSSGGTATIDVRAAVRPAPAPNDTLPTWLPVTPSAPTRARAIMPEPPPPPPPPPAPSRRGVWALTAVAVALVFALGGAVILARTWPGDTTKPGPTAEGQGPVAPKGDGPVILVPPGPGASPTPRDTLPQPPAGSPLLPRALEQPGTRPPEIFVPEFNVREAEVVFCLDTTGSMGGMLDGTKKSIWSMCKRIAAGTPTPRLRVGLVAYRDKGDQYVTQPTDLTADLDAVQAKLDGLTAGGGGDHPEHVNKALEDAVGRMSWSPSRKTLKLVFLVGDAPPHMDYSDDVKYPATLEAARKAGIVVNAIQCGNDRSCREAWKDIAEKGGGEYVAVAQAGGVRVRATEFDDDIVGLGRKLYETALIYGTERERMAGEAALARAGRLSGPLGADRAAFAAKSKRLTPRDLIDAVEDRTVALADVKREELPKRLAEFKDAADRRDELARVAAARKKLREEILALEKKREEAIRALGGAGKAALDEQVVEILRKQAKAFDIRY